MNKKNCALKLVDEIILYANKFPLKINSVSKPILFTDDTSVIISSRNFTDFFSVSNLVPSHIVKLFAANKLS